MQFRENLSSWGGGGGAGMLEEQQRTQISENVNIPEGGWNAIGTPKNTN